MFDSFVDFLHFYIFADFTSKLFDNEHMENAVLKLGSEWTVLKTSYTQSGGESGRPTNESQGEDVTPTTERNNDAESSDPDNRV